MARKARVDLNGANIRKILKSQRVSDDMKRRAEAIKRKAESLLEESSDARDDFVVHSTVSGTRSRSAVITASAEAMIDESANKSLTKSIDAGRP